MASRGLRFGSLVAFTFGLLLVLIQTSFFSRPFNISFDTFTYTNLPGLQAGLSLSNFSSGTRTPGYSLFLSLVTLGEVPRPETISLTFCGQGILGGAENCQTAVPPAAEVVVRQPPVVWGYSKTTEAFLGRAILAGKLLFVASIIFVFWSLMLWFGPILALLCSMLVFILVPSTWYSHFLDIVQTESLFPSLALIYIASVLVHRFRRSGLSLIAASLCAILCFLVRPVFIYLVVIHAGYLMYSAIVDKARRISSIVSGIIIAAPVAWVFLWSPLTFFSDANFQSSALRAAVLSDHETVSCVEGEQIKQVLGAYVRSINADPSVEDKLSKAKTYIERYYIFALANSYRLDQPSHPMYKEERIRQIVDASQGSVLARVVEAAANCNRWRNTDFTIQVVRTTFGIAPGMRPFTPSDFFNFPLSFYLSCVALLLALLVLVAEQRYTLAFLTAYAVSLHLAMVFIVALKQGGESRYTNTTEPLFILGAGMGGAAVIQTLLRLASRRFQRITLP